MSEILSGLWFFALAAGSGYCFGRAHEMRIRRRRTQEN